MWATHRTLIFCGVAHFPLSADLGLGFPTRYGYNTRGRMQLGSALRSGRRGRGFKSRHSVNRRPFGPDFVRLAAPTASTGARAGTSRGGWCGDHAARADCGTRGRRCSLRHTGSCGNEGGGRAWPGFRADAPSRRLAARTASGRADAPGCRKQLGGGPTPLSTEKGHRHCAVTDRERRPYPSAARSPRALPHAAMSTM